MRHTWLLRLVIDKAALTSYPYVIIIMLFLMYTGTEKYEAGPLVYERLSQDDRSNSVIIAFCLEIQFSAVGDIY